MLFRSPVIPFEERLAIVGAIDCVDEVMRIESEELLSKVEAWYARPFDVAFSGSDHATDPYWQMEEQILSTLGARIEYLPYTQSTSSTLIRRALEQGQGD